MNKQRIKNFQAFTLVELIVVITILAILGTIAFISLQGYSATSRDSVRISDTGNMKTTLELFHLNSGKYPLPDNYTTAQYLGTDLFHQGTFGETVVKNVSRNISKAPTDPLTEREYIYSVGTNKNELEILSLMETNDFSLNTTKQTNAAGITVTPRIAGNYNGLFIKNSTYIVPLPSIINTEATSGTLLAIDSESIKSMVTNKGDNVPDGQGDTNTLTGQLVDLNLSVWTGSLDNDSDNTDKLAVYEAISTAYSGSSLGNDGIIADLLSKTTDEDKIVMTEIVVLKNTVVSSSTPIVIKNTVLACGTTMGEVMYTTSDGTDTGLTCSDDIITCNGTTGSGIIISACNAGAITVYSNQTFLSTTTVRNSGVNEWAGGLYQWGNNEEISYSTPSTNQLPVGDINSTYNGNGSFIYDTADWNTTPSDEMWGNSSSDLSDKIGPCPANYHVPSQTEWFNLVDLKWDNASNPNQGTLMGTNLKMPMSGYRNWYGVDMANQGPYGIYWSSSPNGTDGYNMHFHSTYIDASLSGFRSGGLSVRCFKN